MTISRLETDKSDYQPGETATITAGGFVPGSEVTFEVEHVTDPGADGIYGTSDDVIVDLGGKGHDPWTVKDGSKKDLDGKVNGEVVTKWFVHPDDSLGARFLLTAAASDGWGATATFTDAGPNTGGTPIAATVNGSTPLIFDAYTTAGSTGTGIISSFVRIQAPKDEAFESGYNTSGRPVQFDENTSPQFTYAITLSMVPRVTIDGQDYYQFNLDLNESDKDSGPLITLHNVKLFASSSPTLTNMNATTALFPTTDARLLYDMDGSGNVTVSLTDWNSGSGTGDYRVSVPVSLFNGVSLSEYIYLYSEFGTKNNAGSPAEGGFEEWFVVKQANPSMAIDKVAAAGQVADVAGETLNYTITVTNTGNVALTGVTLADPGATVLRLTDLSGDNDATLEVGEIWRYSATRTLTQAELDSNGGGDGDIDNTATADSDQTGPVSDSAVIPVDQNPALNIVKEADAGQVADQAGEKLTYRITVANTGNQALTGVTVTDPTADAGSVVRVADVVGDNDALLEVGETWAYTAERTLTQGEIDSNGGGDGDIDNVATADSNETGEDSDDAAVPVARNPNFAITKAATLYQSNGTTLDSDGEADSAGQIIKYTITMQNTGNVSLTGVTIADPYADSTPVFSSGDANSDGKLSIGETWTYTAQHTVTQAELDNNGGGDGKLDNTAIGDTAETASKSASASIDIYEVPAGGLIAPTNTSPLQYIKGPAFYDTFQEYYESSPGANNGVVQYGVKGGNINQTNPGVFFYFTGASGQLVSSGTGTMSIVVDQTVTTTDTLSAGKTAQNYSFLPTFQNIALYRVNDLNANGMVDGADTLSSVRIRAGNVTFGTGSDHGDITVSFNGGAAGTMYVLSVKYSTGTVVGQPGATLPTFDYTYATKLGSSGTVLESGELSMAAKSAMMLDGEAGDGARSVSKSQVNQVLKQAMAYWEGQGISDEQVAMLKDASVEISNIGGTVLAQSDTSQRMITIDNDGAGHGWSLGIGTVAPDKVDLFSVLVHEMGHLLGESDEEMGNLLAVGERTLPQSASSSDSLPLPASILGVVGTETAPTENHFG